MATPAKRPARKTVAKAKSVAPPSVGPHHDQAMAVLQQFRFIFKSVKKHFQWVERETGVSGSQLWALAHIAASPGLRVTELARALVVHQSTASNLLDRLVQRNLVRRERTSADQRVVRLYATPRGQSIVAKAPRPFEGVLPDALLRLPHDDLRALDGLLKSVALLMRVRDASGRRTPLADI
ncbi:MAG: MarR family transcriptional regulator [Betaproteobacteria bacterium]|nr:MarR family transcriptional regulator [Betaproteobacteria bacterium]